MSRPSLGQAKRWALLAMGRLTGRHALLLPAAARDERRILEVKAPYRVEGTALAIELLDRRRGDLSARLLGYDGFFPTRSLWEGSRIGFEGPAALTLDLPTGAIHLGGQRWGQVSLPLPGRRLAWDLHLAIAGEGVLHRRTGHYLPGQGRIGAGYYQGDDYVDHEAQSFGERARVVGLLREHGGRGPVLEIGCATGGMLEGLAAAGFDGVGVDVSEWAVARASERLGPGRAWACDAESSELPEAVIARRPYGVLLLWAVLEHFADPFAVLARLTPLAAPGGLLLINTSNADSLTRFAFGADWEGYFDWTHRGVDRIGVERLRQGLEALGWRIRQLTTDLVWTGSADPTHATLRDWWAGDARFRRLVAERNLGDFITCVAVKA